MSARRFADAQALASVGATISRRFLALELNQWKAYAATSSLLKKNSFQQSEASTTTTTTTATEPLQSKQYQQGESFASPLSPLASLLSPKIPSVLTGADQAIFSNTQSQNTQKSPQLHDTVTTESPSLDHTKSTTTASIGYSDSGHSTYSNSISSSESISESGYVKEKANRDALETLLRESKWIDSLPAEDITKLNREGPGDGGRWTQKERLGPRMMVYESLAPEPEEEDTGVLEEEKSGLSGSHSAEANIHSSSTSFLSGETAATTNLESSVDHSAAETTNTTTFQSTNDNTNVRKNLTAAPMPTSRVGRLFHYGGNKLHWKLDYTTSTSHIYI
jgi:hypothetical protein